jgi:hypothetical protein
MRAGKWSSLIVGAVTGLSCLAAMPATAANSYAVNPLGFFYENSDAEPNDPLVDAYRFVDEYKHPTAMLITGRCNRYADHFTQARARGAEVLAYLNVIEQPNTSACALEDDFYKVDGQDPERWIGTDGLPRKEYPQNEMLNTRAGLPWSDRVVEYVRQLMIEDKVDGVFLDVVAARLWSVGGNWENRAKPDGVHDDPKGSTDDWTQQERDEWTAGNADLVRRLDELRESINPRFIIVNNGFWEHDNFPAGKPPEDVAASHVDGICIEHHVATDANKAASAGRSYGSWNGTRHRRLLIIANTDAEASAWAPINGVTHIASQHRYDPDTHPTEGYGSPSRPTVIPLNPLTDRQKLFGKAVAGPDQSQGMNANQKRASRFSLSERGRLRELSAYLNGNGGASGSQVLKLVLYADNGGVPGAKVAESNERTVNAGDAAKWFSFSLTTANQKLLNPGSYWIAIFTGNNTQVATNFSEASAAANWYRVDDVYSDGASDPYGSTNVATGNVTLSVRAGYTPE